MAKSDSNPPPPPAPPPNAESQGANVDDNTKRSYAKGKGTEALGQQVSPATQTNEADGNRTLMHPVVDPGPYIPEGQMEFKHPDRTKGEHRYSDSNEPFEVTMRTSTGHDQGYGDNGGAPQANAVKLAPDLAISGAASDCYHPDGGDSLTQQAVEVAAQPKELAPTKD